MAPHVHIGLVEFVSTVCYVLLFTLMWRVLAAKLSEKHPDLSSAMTAVYS